MALTRPRTLCSCSAMNSSCNAQRWSIVCVWCVAQRRSVVHQALVQLVMVGAVWWWPSATPPLPPIRLCVFMQLGGCVRWCPSLCTRLCVYIRTKEEVLLFVIVRGNVSEIEREREATFMYIWESYCIGWKSWVIKIVGGQEMGWCVWQGNNDRLASKDGGDGMPVVDVVVITDKPVWLGRQVRKAWKPTWKDASMRSLSFLWAGLRKLWT